MKILWLAAATLFALPGLAGCGGSSSPKNTSDPIFFVPHSVSATLSDGLTATLIEDRSTVSVGGTVTYTATLTNPTPQPITYRPVISGGDSFSAPSAGLIVNSPSGQAVFSLNAAAQYVATGASVTLAPGQAISATEAVSTSQVSGSTIAQGYATAGQYTANARFTVIPGTSSDITQAVTATAGPLTVTAQ